MKPPLQFCLDRAGWHEQQASSHEAMIGDPLLRQNPQWHQDVATQHRAQAKRYRDRAALMQIGRAA